MDDRVERALELLRRLEQDELDLPDVIDRIEYISKDPTVIRETLDRAELQGIIDREDGIIRPKSTVTTNFDEEVISKEGEFSCRRCSCGLSTGYFIKSKETELGPFGSSCIRKVTGRE